MIKITGISRKVDELGRIVLPIELRRNLNIETGDSLEINIDNNKVVLTKKDLDRHCAICSQKNAKYIIKEKYVCDACVNSLMNEKNSICHLTAN